MAETPLHAVFNMKHNSISPVAENLIAYGADINVKNAVHWTASSIFCFTCDLSMENRHWTCALSRIVEWNFRSNRILTQWLIILLQALFAEQECGLKWPVFDSLLFCLRNSTIWRQTNVAAFPEQNLTSISRELTELTCNRRLCSECKYSKAVFPSCFQVIADSQQLA